MHIGPKYQRGYMGPSEPNEYNDGIFPDGCLPIILLVGLILSLLFLL
jgi:hypothetical protein